MGRTMLHYLGPKVGRIPLSTLDEVRLAATGGLLAETQWVELKEMPSPSSRPTNVELAKDLASLSVHGGVLVYGVRDKTFEVVGCDTTGLVDRISSVASVGVHPPLSPVVYPPLAVEDDGAHNVLVVEVPASPQAPHMVADSYWGRSSNGKRKLSDPEVRMLLAGRASNEEAFKQRLLTLVDDDPLAGFVQDHPTGNGHIYLLAAPLAPVVGRTDDLDLTEFTGACLGDNFDHGSPSHLTYRARDPLGMAMSYPNRGDGVERRYEESTCYLLVKDDDASLEFVSGGGTYYREGGFRTGDGPMEVVGTNIIANSAWEFFELLEKLSLTKWGYAGQWRVGIHLTNLAGKDLSFNDIYSRGQTFPRDTFTNVAVTSPASWTDGAEPEARRLLAGFLRAIGAPDQPLNTVGGR